MLSYGKRRSRDLLLERLGPDNMAAEFEVCVIFLEYHIPDELGQVSELIDHN